MSCLNGSPTPKQRYAVEENGNIFSTAKSKLCLSLTIRRTMDLLYLNDCVSHSANSYTPVCVSTLSFSFPQCFIYYLFL